LAALDKIEFSKGPLDDGLRCLWEGINIDADPDWGVTIRSHETSGGSRHAPSVPKRRDLDRVTFEPGHDAWVVGDEPVVGFEFESRSAEEYAKG
jgi:hypothetical protein